MFFNSYHVHTSLVGSRGIHKEMLDFSARHGVRPLIQASKLDGVESIQKVFGDMQENKVKYRAVLVL